MKYNIAIQVGKNVTDILNLPYVMSCYKHFIDEDFNEELVYLVYIESEDYGGEGGEQDGYVEAHFGDWICEDKDGAWHVLSNEEFVKQKEDGKGNE